MNQSYIFPLLIIVTLAAPCYSQDMFTEETEILAVSREDQSNAIRIGLIKQELLLMDVIRVITTFRAVNEEEYLKHDHRPGVRGSVTLKGGETFLWEIEPGYAARIADHRGQMVYLLDRALENPKEK